MSANWTLKACNCARCGAELHSLYITSNSGKRRRFATEIAMRINGRPYCRQCVAAVIETAQPAEEPTAEAWCVSIERGSGDPLHIATMDVCSPSEAVLLCKITLVSERFHGLRYVPLTATPVNCDEQIPAWREPARSDRWYGTMESESGDVYCSRDTSREQLLLRLSHQAVKQQLGRVKITMWQAAADETAACRVLYLDCS